ncbi:MAG: DNA topoisomerase III [Verrucomicrobia bacterium]|nr:MAG: DNA topoisomerase III [Verrucomicrobiota bacterium]
MGKALVIAEKPSVATDIARVLRAPRDKSKDFFENDDYVISSAVGHLLTIIVPPDQDIKRGKWTFDKLPHIPTHFDLEPIAKSESRLRVLLRLIKRDDVDRFVNACDAGREGELIFRYIIQYATEKHPRKTAGKSVSRLWLRSMTPDAIHKGFANLRSDDDMKPLASAANCRSEADWLVGINGTRAMTAFNSKSGGFYLTPVGRVQTPTLAVVVEREKEIRVFEPKDYWEVHATFRAAAGEYTGRWLDESFKKDSDDAHKRAERIWEQAKADSIQAKCDGQAGEVSEQSKPTKQAAPALFDLTTLQREANSRFGFSARNTLGIAQALYERHKVLTYPRTDSRCLPEDYSGTVKQTLESLGQARYGSLASDVLKNDWVHGGNKKVFNNAKISDHFAIIPTLKPAPATLKEQEQKIYDLVAKRFIAVFYPSAEFLVTTRITRVEGEPFKTEGKVLVKPGWLTVYGRDQAKQDDGHLVPVETGESVQADEVIVEAKATRPPARHSEATLLGAMEHAGKRVDDEELREAMRDKGLGTPATRASIIEELIRHKYMVREQKELVPTAQASSLITLLTALKVDALTKPELTGEWEFKLKEIERRKFDRESFMNEIRSMTEKIVGTAKAFDGDTVPGDYGKLKTPCPKCGGVVKETYKRFHCEGDGCEFSFWKTMGGRQFELSEADELVANGRIGPLDGFRSKMGRAFSAELKLTGEHKVEFDFGNGDEDEEEADFSGQEPVGTCPKCKCSVYEHGRAYVCEKNTGKVRECSFRTGKTILKRDIEKEQVAKLLKDGRTDLILNFISKKGRPFKAYLVLKPDGDVGFEFEPRAKAEAGGGARGGK